jgi:hypothetical protein
MGADYAPMENFPFLEVFLLLCLSAACNTQGMRFQEPNKVESGGIEGKVFRSDSNAAVSNSYILLENESPTHVEHFDVRTDDKGKYQFKEIPVGNYKLSIYAWCPNKSDVPCQNPGEAKTVDDGMVTVKWQRKSRAFMEIVTIKGFSVGAGRVRVKDFDLFCK